MIDTKPLGRIESIIPAGIDWLCCFRADRPYNQDFNYDGRLDLLVVGRKSSTTFQMHVLLQNADATGFESAVFFFLLFGKKLNVFVRCSASGCEQRRAD